jgi:hypothetical protein
MAIIDINDLKNSFSVGKRPVEEDFVNLIDTLAAPDFKKDSTILSRQQTLMFTGGGVSASTIAASNLTKVTISGGISIQDEGVYVTKRDTLNFVGLGVTVTDVSASNLTKITISGGGKTKSSSITSWDGSSPGPYTKKIIHGFNLTNAYNFQISCWASSASIYSKVEPADITASSANAVVITMPTTTKLFVYMSTNA